MLQLEAPILVEDAGFSGVWDLFEDLGLSRDWTERHDRAWSREVVSRFYRREGVLSDPDEAEIYGAMRELSRPGLVTQGLAIRRFAYFSGVWPVLGVWLAGLPRGTSRVWEVGCGSSILGLLAAREFPEIQFFGVDQISACVRQSNRWARDLGLNNFEAREGDFSEPSAGGPYDAAFGTCIFSPAKLTSGWRGRAGVVREEWEGDFVPSDADVRRHAEWRVRKDLEGVLGSLRPGGRFFLHERLADAVSGATFGMLLGSAGFSGNVGGVVAWREPVGQAEWSHSPWFSLSRPTEGGA